MSLLSTISQSKLSPFMAVTCFAMSISTPALSAGNAKDGEYGEKYAEVEGLPQLDFTTYTPQIFWMVVLFFVLYVFFAKKTLPDISGVIENRKNHIDGDLKTAEELTAKSDAVQASYKEKLAQAQADAASAVKEVEGEAKAKVDAYLQSFQERAEGELSSAEASIEKEKEKIMGEMDDIVSQTSAMAVDKIIGQTPKASKKAA